MKITLDGTDFDGEYELDDNVPLSGREIHWIKAISGLRRNELEDGLKAGDYDLEIAFAVIALVRAGKVTKQQALAAAELLSDAPVDSVTTPEDAELEPDPPTAPNENGANAEDEETKPSSTTSSEPDSDQT